MVNFLSSQLEKKDMHPAAKGVLLVVGAYVVTVGMAVIIFLLAVMFLLITDAWCDTVSKAILVLWITIAAIFIASIFVVRGVAWKITPDTARRLAIVGLYAVAMLVSYGVIAFGIMVLFNC